MFQRQGKETRQEDPAWALPFGQKSFTQLTGRGGKDRDAGLKDSDLEVELPLQQTWRGQGWLPGISGPQLLNQIAR